MPIHFSDRDIGPEVEGVSSALMCAVKGGVF
jgi:hypothetical protein